MTLRTWALSLIGSNPAKMPKEKKQIISIMGNSSVPVSASQQAAPARATEAIFNASRCRQLAEMKPHSIFRQMSRLSRMAWRIAAIEAPPCPKDFTTGRPRAYSSVAAVRSRPAWADTGAFTALWRDTRSRNRKDSAVPAREISAASGLTASRHRRIHRKFRYPPMKLSTMRMPIFSSVCRPVVMEFRIFPVSTC